MKELSDLQEVMNGKELFVCTDIYQILLEDDASAAGIENNEDNVFSHYKSTKLESIWFSLADGLSECASMDGALLMALLDT
jgi:hypothetical protein